VAERDERTTSGRESPRSLDERQCDALERIAKVLEKIHEEMVAVRGGTLR
jgi:hypothetical protein